MSTVLDQRTQFAQLHAFMNLIPASTNVHADTNGSFLFMHAATVRDAFDVLAVLGTDDWEPKRGNLRSSRSRLGFDVVTIMVTEQQAAVPEVAPELLAAIK